MIKNEENCFCRGREENTTGPGIYVQINTRFYGELKSRAVFARFVHCLFDLAGVGRSTIL